VGLKSNETHELLPHADERAELSQLYFLFTFFRSPYVILIVIICFIIVSFLRTNFVSLIRIIAERE
jgi:hypothetical protein